MAVKLPNTSGPPYDAILVANNTNYVGNLSAQVIDTVLSGNLNFLSNAQLFSILSNYLTVSQFEQTSNSYGGYPYLGFFIDTKIVTSSITQILDSGNF